MADIEALVSQIPIDQVARQLGVSESEAEQAVRQALPALVGGMKANADDPAGAASLAGALSEHGDDLLDGGIDLDQVDTADGQKIVRNVFGDNEDQVIQTLGGQGGGSMFSKLLPILAPIVLSYLAKSFGGGGTKAGAQAESGGGMGGLGDILGGMLGGGEGGGFGGLGDVLGGLLGRGKR
jgi:hypothetical protein